MDNVRSDSAARIAPHLFRMAIFPTTVFTKDAGLSQSTAKRVIGALKDAEMITEVLPHKGSSPAVLAFPKLLRLVEDVEFL